MAKQLSPAEFTLEFAKGLRAARPGVKVEILGDKQLSLSVGAGKPSTAYLDNAYIEYIRDPGALKTIIEKFSQSLAEWMGSKDPVNRSQIVPVVKDRNWLADIREALKQRGAKDPQDNIYDELNAELVIVYAEDSPRSIRYLTPKLFSALGIAREDLRSLAVENLRRIVPRFEVRPGTLFSQVRADGTYDVSLLLFEEIWANRQIQADGDYVVAVPSRDALLVTGSRNPAGIAKLSEVAAQISIDSPYRLTSDLFVYREGSFRKLPQQ